LAKGDRVRGLETLLNITQGTPLAVWDKPVT